VRRIILASVLILLLSTSTANWAAAGDNILWADNGVPVCTGGLGPSQIGLVGDGLGGAIVAWRDWRNGTTEIWAQRLDANGDSLWAADGVLVASPDFGSMNPKLATDGAAGAIIIWEDWRSGINIYAQRVDFSGDTLWTLDGEPICQAADNQTDPQIISDDDGGAIVTWEDFRTLSHYDIYAQRVDGDGNMIWAINGQTICTFSDQQENPQLCSDGAKGAIIVWRDHRSGTNYDIYAQRVDLNGNTKWTGNGVVICNASNDQEFPHIVSDGAGGAIIGWYDYRSGTNYDIYAQRVDSNGNVLWATNGEAICIASGNQSGPWMASDGSGGAILTWQDYRGGGTRDIYAQRVDSNGNVLWTVNGEPICAAADDQAYSQIAGDGSGGAILAWGDKRSGSKWDVYAQRIDAYGDTIPPADGLAICNALHNQTNLQQISDDAGGVIIAWEDYRSGVDTDIYAQRVHFNPAPEITSIDDVPVDQGREVSVVWDRSYLDDPWYKTISEYSIWRKYPAGIKGESMGQEWDGSLPKDRTQRIYRLIEEKGSSGEVEAKAWEYIGSVLANYFESYAYIAPTLEDSSGSGIPYFSFIVTAHTGDPYQHWDSEPDSGYSVDDINPAKTQVGIVASRSAKGAVNTIWLSWAQVTAGEDGSPERGAIDYRIYCDESPDFTPAPENLLTTVSGLSYPHTDSRIGDPVANLYYLVTAADGSDNESAVSNRVGEFDRSLSATK
jgi:predicted lipoprotein with Yx(FWY)xxD motif